MELLIIIVIISILAAITIVSFNGLQDRARQAKILQDFQVIKQSISAAQAQTGGTLNDIVADFWIGQDCSSVPTGTILSTLPRSHSCWTRYIAALDKISTAGRVNIRDLVDPWGSPYRIDSNEGESIVTPCTQDALAVYAIPTNASIITNYTTLPNVLARC